jgi:GntR family transcriptional repressor for pyruvate dehydrogenase complex
MAYIERVGQQTKCDRVTEQIKSMIIAGTYKTGDKLPPELELCEMFGVSRITIRESLKKLNVMGMIEILQGKGTFVKTIDLATFMKPLYQMIGFEKIDIQTIYNAREYIEGGIAYLAASNRTEQELSDLKAIVFDLKEAIEREDIMLVETLDKNFHLQLAECSHNTLLHACLEVIEEINTACKIRVNKYHMMLENCFSTHYEIFRQVSEQNPDNAKKAMVQHTRESLKLLL